MSAIGIGAIAGLRAMTAPAIVGWAVNRHWVNSRRIAFLDKKSSVSILSSLAVGELIADKLPSTPSRTAPFGLTARVLAGGFAAGALCASKRKPVIAGALLGGLAAVAGAYVGYTVRRKLGEQLHVDDKAIAVAEDAIAIGGGVLLLRSA